MTALNALDWIDAHERELADALSSLRCSSGTVALWGRTLAERLTDGGRLLAAGNGGSAAEAQHLTSELVGRFLEDRRPFSAISLCAESSSITALVNDYGVDEMFARQVEGHGRPGDVLVLLSTSGRSPNVLRAAERGRDIGLEVWAMTGPAPNPLAELSHSALCVDAPSTAAVQAVHLVAIHALCAVLDSELAALAEHEALRQATAPVSPDVPGSPDEPAAASRPHQAVPLHPSTPRRRTA